MKLLVLYRPMSEHGTKTEEYLREYRRIHPGQEIEMLNLDSREGADKAKVYDIVQYPAILALTDDGQLKNFWQGEPLPLMNEVAASQL